MRFCTLAVLASAAVTACGHLIQRQTTASDPIPPSEDPWYAAPAGYADYPPGTVFKVRSASGLVPLIANTSAAYQLLYRTTNSQYTASWAVTTLLIPFSNYTTTTTSPTSCSITNSTANSTANSTTNYSFRRSTTVNSTSNCTTSTTSNSFLSYGLPYDSADVDDSPSYALYTGGGAFGTGEISTALGRGWSVSIADYEGPNASFTAGVQSGHATLDSVRACFNVPEFGFNYSTTTYAMWGYSGGALASEWAAELQVQYAPELVFAGAALGGTTPNVTSVLFTINGTIYAGLAPAGILGLASQYPEAQTYIADHLVQTGAVYNAANFYATKNYSLIQDIGAYAGQDISAYFTNGVDAFYAPITQYVINRDGIMGYHGVPAMPLFVYKAIGDDISNITDTDELVARYCGVGATIQYQRNTVGDHATELIYGRASALNFLDQIFDKTYNATGCQITNVTID